MRASAWIMPSRTCRSRTTWASIDRKPMKQHEFVTGADWAMNPNWALTFRYARKRLDNAIEDMSITDNLGFYRSEANEAARVCDGRRLGDESQLGADLPLCAQAPG